MELLDYLDGWVRDYQGPPEVVVGLFRGTERGDCAVRWLSAEGPCAFGNLTLWESGDVAIEIYDSRTGVELLSYRGRADTRAALAPHLTDLVGRAAGDREEDDGGVRDQSRSRPLRADGPLPPRRLRY